MAKSICFCRNTSFTGFEGMGLVKNTSEAILALSVLLSHIPVSEKSVAAIKSDVLTGKGRLIHYFMHSLYDAKRFTRYSRIAIEQEPLQTYILALIFAPKKEY